MTVHDLLAVFGLAVTILVGLAAVTAYLRGTTVKAERDRLMSSNDALRAERADEQRRSEKAEAEVTRLVAEASRKDAALARIGEQAVGTGDIRELAEAVRELAGLNKDHDHEASKRHAATIRALRDINKELAEVHEAQGKRSRDA